MIILFFRQNDCNESAVASCSNWAVDACSSKTSSSSSSHSDGIPCDSNSDSNSDSETEPAKRKRIHQTFSLLQSFENEEDALKFLAIDGCWSAYYSTKSDDGVRQKYRCNKVKFRAKNQCAKSCYLLYDSRSSKVNLFMSDSEHDHVENANSVYEIPIDTKNAIRDMFEMGVCKPKQILNNLMIKKYDIPDRTKFDSYLKSLRKERDGEAKINMNDMKKWLEDNSLVPVDKTKPFVLHYEISFDEKNPFFRFFVTTKQLLSLAIDTTKVQTDATYKITWQGYPMFQIGTTDMHKSFHPYGVAVCMCEQTDDFR